MRVWPVGDAKARFSELLDACVRDGPQVVSRRGTQTAVLVPMSEWNRIASAARPTLKQLLLSEQGRTELELPPRGSARRRPGQVV
jgi:prevent-host-death family protein